MAHIGLVNQWDLFSADLDPAVGREQGGGARPVLVVSNDGFNRVFDVVTVLPVTKEAGKKRKIFPFEVRLPANAAGNELESIIMPQQIRTISKARLLKHLGAVTNPDLRIEIEDRILDHLGISLEADE